MQEQGKSSGANICFFPGRRRRIKALFLSVEDLHLEAPKVVPPRELLQGALRRAAAGKRQYGRSLQRQVSSTACRWFCGCSSGVRCGGLFGLAGRLRSIRAVTHPHSSPTWKNLSGTTDPATNRSTHTERASRAGISALRGSGHERFLSLATPEQEQSKQYFGCPRRPRE